MRVVIMAVGTAGDIYPYTDVAARLAEAGHEVVLAAEESFRPLLEGAGFPFRPIESGVQDWVSDQQGDAAGKPSMRQYLELARRAGNAMVNAYDGMVAAVSDADMLLVSYAVAVQGYLIAKALGIPSMGLYMVPVTPTREFAPALPGVAGRSLGAVGNRLVGPLMTRMASPFTGWVRTYQNRLGLPVSSLLAVDREMTGSGWPIRYGFSSAVLPRPADWPGSVDVVGYWWPRMRDGWEPSAELMDFVAAGPAPVLVTLGSMGAGRLSDVFGVALRRARVRGIIQAGTNGARTASDDVIMVGNVDYEWLMPKLSAVVHHGGAGTAAAALRCGIPSISVPIAFDNMFWARRLTDIGVSPGFVPVKYVDAGRLGNLIGRAVWDPALRHRAAEIADLIGKEDGAGRVLHDIDQIVHRRQSG
jgi:UDP:flavonoid glycosyltransferase YjiC (YdhE family)